MDALISKTTVIFCRIIMTFNWNRNDSAQSIEMKERRGMDDKD
jgi:hypothetical protein